MAHSGNACEDDLDIQWDIGLNRNYNNLNRRKRRPNTKIVEIDNKCEEPYFIEVSDDDTPSLVRDIEREKREKEQREHRQYEERERSERHRQEAQRLRLERERREREDERMARKLQEQLDREMAEALQNQNSNFNTPINTHANVRHFFANEPSPISQIPIERLAPSAPRADGFSQLLRQMQHQSRGHYGHATRANFFDRIERGARNNNDLEFINRDFNEGDYEMLLRLDDNKKKGLSKNELNQLPTFKIMANNLNEDDKQCSICFDDFKTGEEVKALTCLHKFHCNCIEPWLKTNRSCPLCKKDAFKAHP